jgi:hypothetical protein
LAKNCNITFWQNPMHKSFERNFGKKNFRKFGKKILGKQKKVFGKPDSQKFLEKLWRNFLAKS